MTDDRVARGRRVLGHRRLCANLVATLALLIAGGSAAIATGQSGGAGTGAGPGTTTSTTTPTAGSLPAGAPSSSGLPGRGMWIWYMGGANGGDVSSIVATAQRYRVRTLMIKAGDGSSSWSQFNAQLVSALHANGLHVCAWQYVYGDYPVAEAHVGATAVANGADCLLIDAESQYEGKYVQAQRYITVLRNLIGTRYPLALAGFPYVDYHPAFPYSVFLGPGGAQFNAPQMYWQDIGTSVDAVYAHTFLYNRLYGRAIYPLGQTYSSPPPRAIVRFRELSLAYGANGLSWWDWSETSPQGWRALSQPLQPLAGFAASAGLASVRRGNLGDLVVWAQQHLVSAGHRISVDGSFGPRTLLAVRRFQSARGLAPTGVIDAPTWRLLLRYPAAYVHWALHVKHASRRTASAAASSAGLTPIPKSASRPAIRDEIRGAGGAGMPTRRPR